jgi:hypothetical protein
MDSLQAGPPVEVPVKAQDLSDAVTLHNGDVGRIAPITGCDQPLQEDLRFSLKRMRGSNQVIQILEFTKINLCSLAQFRSASRSRRQWETSILPRAEAPSTWFLDRC